MELYQKLLDATASEWPSLLEGLSEEEIENATDDAINVAERISRIAAYLLSRGLGFSHEESLFTANAVRDALSELY